MSAVLKRSWIAFAAVCVALITAVGGAASVTPPLLVSEPSPFTGCTADHATDQQQFSTLYPNAEPEPRATINPTNPNNIVGMYQQDRWDNGGARGLVAAVSHSGGTSWQDVVIPGITKCSNGA
jgi:hypothetical protein